MEKAEVAHGIHYFLIRIQLISAIEEFLQEQLADGTEDMTIPAILLVHSVNKAAVKNVSLSIIFKPFKLELIVERLYLFP